MSKFDKKCSKCKNYNGNILICESCAHYKPKPTVFEHITKSMETLAEGFVYYIEGEHSPFDRRWKSTLTGDVCYVNRSSAFEATIEELKKEWRDDT